jgi:hypothetical protein
MSNFLVIWRLCPWDLVVCLIALLALTFATSLCCGMPVGLLFSSRPLQTFAFCLCPSFPPFLVFFLFSVLLSCSWCRSSIFERVLLLAVALAACGCFGSFAECALLVRLFCTSGFVCFVGYHSDCVSTLQVVNVVVVKKGRREFVEARKICACMMRQVHLASSAPKVC